MGPGALSSLPRSGRSARRTQPNSKVFEQRVHLLREPDLSRCMPNRNRCAHRRLGDGVATKGFSATGPEGFRQSKILRFYTHDERMSELPPDPRNLSSAAQRGLHAQWQKCSSAGGGSALRGKRKRLFRALCRFDYAMDRHRWNLLYTRESGELHTRAPYVSGGKNRPSSRICWEQKSALHHQRRQLVAVDSYNTELTAS
jgi:hypothetical protein